MEDKKEVLIEVRDMLVEFKTRRGQFKAVKGVSFDVYKGETFGLVGESGSGKTTIGRTIVGVNHLTDGQVFFDNRLIRGNPPELIPLQAAALNNINRMIKNQESLKVQLFLYVDTLKEEIAKIDTYEKVHTIRYKSKSADLEIISHKIKSDLKLILKTIRIQQKSISTLNSVFELADKPNKQLITTQTEALNHTKDLMNEVANIYHALNDLVEQRSRYKNLKSFKEYEDYMNDFVKKLGNILVEVHKIDDILVEEVKLQTTSLENLQSDSSILNLINNHPKYKKMSGGEKQSLKKEIQMIFQDPAASLNERATVEYIVLEGLKNIKNYKGNVGSGLSKSEHQRQLAVSMLKTVGLLPEHMSRYPHEFSGGQRQRIGIARSLIMEPKLVVADEPISALDVSIRAQVLNLMKKMQKENNLTYIFVAHDLSVVRFIADRIAVIYQGNIVELAEAEELFINPLHPYTAALLSAIPLPDPELERDKVHIVYNPNEEHFDYVTDFPTFREVTAGHFVYANNREFKKYQEMLAKNK